MLITISLTPFYSQIYFPYFVYIPSSCILLINTRTRFTLASNCYFIVQLLIFTDTNMADILLARYRFSNIISESVIDNLGMISISIGRVYIFVWFI